MVLPCSTSGRWGGHAETRRSSFCRCNRLQHGMTPGGRHTRHLREIRVHRSSTATTLHDSIQLILRPRNPFLQCCG